MERRILLLPLVWVAFGVGEVLILQGLLKATGIVVPTSPNDKPISGGLLPFLFSTTALTLVVIGLSLYSLGYWQPNLTPATKRGRIEIAVLAVFIVSGLLVFYTPLALFPLVITGFYFLATNLD